jgi:uncharacterized protein
MKIGLISDSHNNIELTKKACEVFKNKKIDMLAHTGDFTSPRILKLFTGFKCKLVKGNADIDLDLLNKQCKKLKIGSLEDSNEFEIEGKKILLIHGNHVPEFRDAVASGKFDYIIKGHTHTFENYIRNNTRIINPGSLCGFEENTVAILDIETDEVEKIDL